MSGQRKTRNGHVSRRMHFCDLARYVSGAFLWIFLLAFFTLPRAMHGVTNTPVADSGAPPSVAAVRVQSTPQHTVIVELFEWRFADVSAECTNFLGPNGYAGVQLSPVTEHSLGGGGGEGWLARYEPISYKFATRSGSIEDFLAMSRACNAAGVRVFVDVVLNHMAGSTDDSLLMGTAGSVANVSALDYSGVPFDARDFHSVCALANYFDAYEVRNCQLDGQPDLNHTRVEVRERIVEFLNRLIRAGVAGFKIDAAKYMHPDDLKAIFESVDNLNSDEFNFEEKSRPIFIQEVVDLGMDAISKTEYVANGIVTEYLYAAELSTIFSGKVPLSSLINWGPAMGFLSHQSALVFVDTHESQRGHLRRDLGKNQLLSYKQQRRYIIATAFMLAHPYGKMRRILSSYHFPANDKQRGPPRGEREEEGEEVGEEGEGGEGLTGATNGTTNNGGQLPSSIRSPEFDINGQCTPASGWVCEHRWPAIVNMLALVNALSSAEDGVIDFQTDGPNHIAFCRGRKAFIAINNDAVLEYAATVHTCLEPGIYCDVISGGPTADRTDCNGKRVAVDENGMTDLMLPAIQSTAIDIAARSNGGDYNTDEAGDGEGGGDGEGAGDDGADDDSVWRGIDVELDYGVIAIYIGSKLLNPTGDNMQWSEVADLNAPQMDLDAQVENVTQISSEQLEAEAEAESLTEGTNFAGVEGQQMANDGSDAVETITEKAVRMKTEANTTTENASRDL